MGGGGGEECTFCLGSVLGEGKGGLEGTLSFPRGCPPSCWGREYPVLAEGGGTPLATDLTGVPPPPGYRPEWGTR